MNKLDCLQAIAALSEKMLTAARDSRWHDVELLEGEERQLASQLATLPLSGIDTNGKQQRRFLEAALQNHAAISAIADPLHADLKALLEAFPETAGSDG